MKEELKKKTIINKETLKERNLYLVANIDNSTTTKTTTIRCPNSPLRYCVNTDELTEELL